MLNRCLLSFALLLGFTTSTPSLATTLQFQTSMGNFEVVLFDTDAPKTVSNFLDYVDQGAYENSIIHRSVAGFVIQGGGFTYEGSPILRNIATSPSVINEPKYSNLRGTIAMAKKSNDPNSATNQWFINLSNNDNLDYDNGGFTVFGMIKGNGLDVVDAIAALKTYNAGSPTGIGGAGATMPLIDFDPTLQQTINGENFVLIYNVATLNASSDTTIELNSMPAIIAPKNGEKKSGGGFNLNILQLIILGFITIAMRTNLYSKNLGR